MSKTKKTKEDKSMVENQQHEEQIQHEEAKNKEVTDVQDQAEEASKTEEQSGENIEEAQDNQPEMVDPLAEENKKLKAEAEEWRDKYLRLSAEFDNYRRRSLNEKMELTKMAGQDLLVKILPVMDDFDRARQTINQATDIEGLKEGFELIYNKFADFLKQQGLKEIEALHTEFDTDLHEALTKIPAPKKKLKGKVVDVIEKGYTLHDKVIRFSKVVVGE